MRLKFLALIVLAFIAVAISQRDWSAPTGKSSVCRRQEFEQTLFTVCKFDALHQKLRLVNKNSNGLALRHFAAAEKFLGEDKEHVRFAMNAGMYDDSGTPIGLYIENSQELLSLNTRTGKGNFHLMPNGIFHVTADGSVHIKTADSYITKSPKPVWATQSGPMLLIDGNLHPGIKPDGPSRYLRNGVGILDDRTAYFVISESPVSFGRLARFFRDKLDCTNALYFDGAVSSLWVPSLKRMDDHNALGPIIVVSDQ
jgi:uncharacterized protein YigE (DUF2233 family)